MAVPTVWLCRGSDCRSRKKHPGAGEVLDALEATCTERGVRLRTTSCLDLCKKGPVAAAGDEAKQRRWFRDVADAATAVALVDATAAEPGLASLPPALDERRLGKRDGSKPKGKDVKRTLVDP